VNDIASRYSAIDKQVSRGLIDAPSAISHYAWVVKDGTLGMAKLASAVPTDADDDEMSIPFVVTTLSEDRDGDVVVPSGCQLHNFKYNPVCFFGHQQNPYPIAKCKSPDGRITVFPEENLVRAIMYFDREDPDAVKVYKKVKSGFLNATSIAFVPIDAQRRDRDEEKGIYNRAHLHQEPMGPPGWIFRQFDLTEISVVGVPSNAGAIRDWMDSDKELSGEFRKSLSPYAAVAKGRCFSGWAPNANGVCVPCDQVSKTANQSLVSLYNGAGGVETPTESRALGDKAEQSLQGMSKQDMLDTWKAMGMASSGSASQLKDKIKRAITERADTALRVQAGLENVVEKHNTQSEEPDGDELREHDDMPEDKALEEAIHKVEEQREKISELQLGGSTYNPLRQRNSGKHGDPMPRSSMKSLGSCGCGDCKSGKACGCKAAKSVKKGLRLTVSEETTRDAQNNRVVTYWVYDQSSRENIAGPFNSRQEAERKLAEYQSQTKEVIEEPVTEPEKFIAQSQRDRQWYVFYQDGTQTAGPFPTESQARTVDRLVGGKSAKQVVRKPGGGWMDCPRCLGNGYIQDPQAPVQGPGSDKRIKCPKCGGAGDVPAKALQRKAADPSQWAAPDPEELEVSGFPKFMTDADDRERLEQQAPTELAAWRQAAAAHHRLTSVNDKLRHRPKLEQAWNALRNAYRRLKKSVRKDTSTSSDVRSPTETSTSTEAYTAGNFTSTVTGGAGDGDTTVNIYVGEPCEFCGEADCDGTCDESKIGTSSVGLNKSRRKNGLGKIGIRKYAGPYKPVNRGTQWFVQDATGQDVAGPFRDAGAAKDEAQAWEHNMSKRVPKSRLRTKGKFKVGDVVEGRSNMPSGYQNAAGKVGKVTYVDGDKLYITGQDGREYVVPADYSFASTLKPSGSSGGGGTCKPGERSDLTGCTPGKGRKGLLESSGTAGGYTVPVENVTDQTSGPGDVACQQCGGEGACPACNGTGTTPGGSMGNECEMCGGDGNCSECEGVGVTTKAKKDNKMATRKATKKPARRGRKDLDNAGNEDELTPGTTANASGEDIVGDTLEKGEEDPNEEPFEPKPSALEGAKAYSQLKELGDYFGEGGDGDLEKMDHPGMQASLKELVDEHIPKAMQHVKDAMAEHHCSKGEDADEFMEKCMKALGDGDMQTGEAGMVDNGDVPAMVENDFDDGSPVEQELEDIGEPGPANELERSVDDIGDAEPDDVNKDGDPDTEEILERYQRPKTVNGKRVVFKDTRKPVMEWATRVVGVARRAKDGRVYIARRKDLDNAGNVSELTPGTNANLPGPDIAGDTLTKSLDTIGKAADHLDAAADDDATPTMHKAGHSYHAKALRETHKELTDAGNPDELDPGTDSNLPGRDISGSTLEAKTRIGDNMECPKCGGRIGASGRCLSCGRMKGLDDVGGSDVEDIGEPGPANEIKAVGDSCPSCGSGIMVTEGSGTACDKCGYYSKGLKSSLSAPVTPRVANALTSLNKVLDRFGLNGAGLRN
jgi:hypothetical protein